MKIGFKASFQKDLKSLHNDAKLFARIKDTILLIETSSDIDAIANVKKLKSDEPYYRIRIGDYRIGVLIEDNTVVFVRILHRSRAYTDISPNVPEGAEALNPHWSDLHDSILQY